MFFSYLQWALVCDGTSISTQTSTSNLLKQESLLHLLSLALDCGMPLAPWDCELGLDQLALN